MTVKRPVRKVTSGLQSFGDLVRQLRRANKLGLVQVANSIRLDPGLLSRIETGKRFPPDLPVLLRLAEVLGVAEDSDQFAELLAAADRARNPELHAMASELRGGKPWNPFSADLMNEEPPIFCRSRAELISKATEHAITTNAISITVKSESGTVQKFQVLHEQKSSKGGRTK